MGQPLFFEQVCTALRALPPVGRLRHALREKCFLARARPRAASLAALRQFTFCRAKKRLKFISRLRTRKSATLAPVFCP